MESLKTRPQPLSTAASLICCLGLIGFSTQTLAQSHAVVTQPLHLRVAPSKASALLSTLKNQQAVTLLDPGKKNGYYHVRVTQTTDGWAWADGVQLGVAVVSVAAHSAPGSRQLVRTPASKELEPVTIGMARAKACVADLSSCSTNGCSPDGSGHALANQMKRATPSGDVPVMLTFDDFANLQQQADNLDGIGEGHDIAVDKRSQLSGLTASAGTVSEGSLVGIVGYLVATPHANSGESVNCNLKGEVNNDFHIPMSNDPNNSDYQGIVAEMIPQNRPDNWSLSNLTQVASNRQLVMVTGGLFYDNIHRVNGDPNNPVGGQPRRYSLWEVHNLTQFLVCTKSDNSCDPARPDDWAPLGQ